MELIPLLAIIGRMISLPFLILTYYHYFHSTKFRYLYKKFFMNYLELLMVTNIWLMWALFNNYQMSRPQYIGTVTWILFTCLVLVLFSNVLMMIHATIIIIIKETRKIRKLSGPNTIQNKNDYKKKLKLYFKLFVVTIFLLCAKWFWFTLDQILKKKELYHIFEYLMMGNALQGLLIFMIFTLKKKQISAFKNRVSGIFSDHTTISELNSSENKINKERYNVEDSIDAIKPLKTPNQQGV